MGDLKDPRELIWPEGRVGSCHLCLRPLEAGQQVLTVPYFLEGRAAGILLFCSGGCLELFRAARENLPLPPVE